MRSPIRASAASAIGIALLVSLGACSLLPSPPAAPGQSATPTQTTETVSEACDALESEVDEVKKEMQQAAAILNTETAAAAELLSVAAFRLNHMAEEEITNDEVVEVATGVSESITVLSDLLTEAAPDPANADSDAIDAAGADVNAAFAAFTEVCPPAGDSSTAACDALEAEAAAVNADLATASEILSDDVTRGAELLAAAALRFEAATADIDDAEVSELATATSDRLTAFSGLINALAADPAHPDNDALSAGSNDLNAAFNDLAGFCAW